MPDCFHCVVSSVKDAAEAVTAPDGRRFAYHDVGDPNGRLVLHNDGGPSSRLEARHQEFGVTGWSEGGPWALAAVAFIHPTRLRHVSSIAPGSYGAFAP
jgi:hypothetical protein